MPFGNIGVSGLILILLIALLIFGPSKLPELGRAFGRTLSEFRSAPRGLVGGTDFPADAGDAESADGKAPAGKKITAAAELAAAPDRAGASDAGAVEPPGSPDASAASASVHALGGEVR